MSDDRITGYAEAALAVAGAEELTSEVEDELFRFARALDGSDELRMTLSDRTIPAARRQQIVEDLIGRQATPASTSLISMMVGAGRTADIGKVADKVVELGAANRARAVAKVRSAIDLTPDQRIRLVDALKTATGKDVEVRVILDESILGGLSVEIDDEVIEDTVQSRLRQLREAF